jgi:peptidylprolyl isomerase
MNVHINGEVMGDIVFGMYGEVTPKSNANFAAMCNQKSGAVTKEGKPLVYAGTCVNTVIPGQIMQAGNINADS